MAKEITIGPWVYFKEKDLKKKLQKLSKTLTKSEFIITIKNDYDLTLNDATIVAEKFYVS